MTAVRVFDPAMCCSSGVCGTSVDPQLARFAADLDWLKGQGVLVERYNLAQQPGAFADNAAVKAALETRGEAGLPVVIVEGDVKAIGVYPSRDELAGWAGVGPTSRAVEPVVKAKVGGCCGSAKIVESASTEDMGERTGGCCDPSDGTAATTKDGGGCCC